MQVIYLRLFSMRFLVATSVGTLSELGGELQRASGAAERIAVTLSQTAEPRHAHRLPAMTDDTELAICFENVSFSYPARPDIAVVNQLNFTASPRQKIAFVGQRAGQVNQPCFIFC